MTDIPRTGLGVRNLQEFYPVPLMPSTAVRFGPFNYPVIRIWRTDNGTNDTSTTFTGAEGTQPVAAVRIWSYQYDTSSVGLRGAVELLNVTEFPSSLLYKPQRQQPHKDSNSVIPFSVAFQMLDAFITAAQNRLMLNNTIPTTLYYATKHNWVDRIHHYVVSFVSKNSAWRLHSLHTPRISPDPLSISICSNTKRSPPRPRFCNHPGIWKCSNPLDASLPPVRLWDHMDLRLQSLQRQYPNLKLEVALVSSQRLSSTSGAMRSTFYNYEALEIVVLTRGRRCTAGSCTTVFVDDYRYERDIVQTNLVDWYGIISTLRGAAQGYVWIRLILLTYGAYVFGQKDDWELGWSSHWVATATLVLKIPFQVVVYSSFFPVCTYVGALLLDSSFMDIFLDSYWASVGGAVNFQLVPFLETTAVQMRSVWLLALLAFMLVFVVRRTRDHWHDGVPGIRGLLISFTSTLTIFGPYKIATLRDTNITSVFRIADEGSTMDIIHSNPSGYVNASSYIFDDSATMLLFCIGAVMVLAVAIKSFGSLTPQDSWIHRESEGVVLSFTPINPSGTRRLWPMSVLSIRFHAVTRPSNVQGPQSSNLTPLIGIIAPSKSQVASAPTIDLIPTRQGPSRHRSISLVNTGTLRRSPLRSVRWSSTEFRSIVQLMNVAMMTDPWNLIWLRVLGIQVYLYQIHRSQSQSNRRPSSFAVILPFGEDEVDGEYELLDSANSKDVPMSLLLQCG
ncbi:hypothetical protein DVH05_002180 [Phytophthora capsici]|nr:hypothetical protein DVH05_002180 [Phytophthora capsici]